MGTRYFFPISEKIMRTPVLFRVINNPIRKTLPPNHKTLFKGSRPFFDP